MSKVVQVPGNGPIVTYFTDGDGGSTTMLHCVLSNWSWHDAMSPPPGTGIINFLLDKQHDSAYVLDIDGYTSKHGAVKIL